MKRKAISAEDCFVARVDTVFSFVELQFVDLFKIPRKSAFGAVDLKSILAFWADHRPACFKSAGCTIFETAEHRREVLVFDFTFRVARRTPTIMTGSASRQRAMSNCVGFHAGYFFDSSDQEVGERNRVTQDVTGNAVASLSKFESPCEQTKFIAAIHRQESTAIVGDSTDRAALN